MKYCTVCKAKYEDNVSFCPVDGEVLEDDPSSIVDTVLDGQYQIEAMLGKGGMGAVYKARHILLGDRVAIKVLPPEVRTNAEWLRRFRREGQAARRFRHPNAVTVYDLRTAGDGTIYMVMEYVEGHTLDAEIKRRGRFTPAEAFETIEPIMSVLNTAHSMGVVHRDLKPENIMMGKAGGAGEAVVKLLDLGIAKMREIAGSDNGGTTALTVAGQVLGTPYYMSPEQWGEIPRDGNEEIDGRADIYSLGLVVYEMIAGHRLCSGATLSELRRQHVSVTLKPLHEAVPAVPVAFSAAISRAIEKDRDDRQATAGQLAAELRAAIEGGVPAGFERTLPDLPYVQSSSAHTAGIAAAGDTVADVEAPTIITMDSSTIGGGPATAAPPLRAPSPAAKPRPFAPVEQSRPLQDSAPTMVESAEMASSITVQQSRPQPVTTSPAAPAERAKPRSAMPFIGAGALILLLVVAVGGYFAFNWFNAKSGSASTADGKRATGNTPPAETAAAPKEIGRYWLELVPISSADKTVRAAGVVPLASGQSFKFHFQLQDDGYVYIFGPGPDNKLTAFLTTKPADGSGVTSNRVSKNSNFSFPGGEQWLTLDKKPGAENYTVVFSPTPITAPALFNAEAMANSLTPAEQAELNNFLEKNKTSEPVTEVNNQSKAEPFVQVRVPASVAGNPIVFPIRIEHK
jgi:serine/threonine-protein kinase